MIKLIAMCLLGYCTIVYIVAVIYIICQLYKGENIKNVDWVELITLPIGIWLKLLD